MVLQIPDVLNAEQVAQARLLLDSAEWFGISGALHFGDW